MKFIGATALVSFFLLPNFVLAACVSNGATVVYINGIFTSEKEASADLDSLHRKYISRTGDLNTEFINGYNPSHIAGLGDIAEAAAQTLNSPISDFDLNTILLQIYPQVTTRKLVLVGHSQGALYSNELYDYLLAHGEPRAAVGVYQVGTPASFVAGGGRYVTSSNDSVINAARLIASAAPQGLVPLAAQGSAPAQKPPLPANIELPADGDGHGFSGAYLAGAPGRIVGDIEATLGALKPEWATGTGECFTPPDEGLAYDAQKAGFAAADAAAQGVRAGVGAAQAAAIAMGDALASALEGAYGVASKIAADIGTTAGGVAGLSHAAEPEDQPTNFDILKKLYGSSLTKEEYEDYLGGQGSAVASAPIFNAPAQEPQEAGETAPDPAPAAESAPAKITYLGHSHAHHDAPEPVAQEEAPAEEPAQEDAPEPPAEDAASSTPSADEATATPEAPAEPAFMTGGSPVTDSFDSYDGSGWKTYGSFNNFGFAPGVLLYAATTSGDCHSGGCIVGSTQVTNGGYGNPVRMYRTGAPVAEGSLVIWKKYQAGFQGTGGVSVEVCVGAPDSSGSTCDGLVNGLISGTPGVWQEYYLAWRDNGGSKEICGLKDDTDPSHCVWQASRHLTAGQAPDTVAIAGDAIRPDLGDRIWFDGLGTP